jgi:hypothetical protein
MVITSGPDVVIRKACDDTPLCAGDLKAMLQTTYVFCDVAERMRFASANFDQIMTQPEAFYQPMRGSGRFRLSFNRPCKGMMMMCRRECNTAQNFFTNYSGINGRDPIASVCLLFNGQPRFQPQSGKWLRTVQPLQHAEKIPSTYVYMYSFAVDLGAAQPTGQCNFSRIDNAELVVNLQPGLENEMVEFFCFAITINVFRVVDGVAGCIFG